MKIVFNLCDVTGITDEPGKIGVITLYGTRKEADALAIEVYAADVTLNEKQLAQVLDEGSTLKPSTDLSVPE